MQQFFKEATHLKDFSEFTQLQEEVDRALLYFAKRCMTSPYSWRAAVKHWTPKCPEKS
jgi:hypothetical protein